MRNLKMMSFAIVVFAAAMFCGSVEAVRAQSGSMQWRGTVDDVVQVRIRNRNALAATLSGRAYNDDNFSFNGRAPRGRANVRVEKTRGRGRVFITQQPNRRNNFTTIVQIVDAKGGPDRYRFNLYWD